MASHGWPARRLPRTGLVACWLASATQARDGAKEKRWIAFQAALSSVLVAASMCTCVGVGQLAASCGRYMCNEGSERVGLAVVQGWRPSRLAALGRGGRTMQCSLGTLDRLPFLQRWQADAALGICQPQRPRSAGDLGPKMRRTAAARVLLRRHRHGGSIGSVVMYSPGSALHLPFDVLSDSCGTRRICARQGWPWRSGVCPWLQPKDPIATTVYCLNDLCQRKSPLYLAFLTSLHFRPRRSGISYDMHAAAYSSSLPHRPTCHEATSHRLDAIGSTLHMISTVTLHAASHGAKPQFGVSHDLVSWSCGVCR
jgi:hypothetical protein